MSDHEFDTYLTLLARLLRLGGKQRAAIAGELRAHLEDRLDELLARGMSRDEAVKLALEEFGDAAVLATEFVSISRNRKRRWMMRATTASAAAIVLIAAGIFTFWPGSNAGPGAAALVAQNPVDPTGPGPGRAGDEKRAAQGLTLDDKLNQRIDAEWVETPFKDVIDYLHDTTKIPFYMKAKKIEDAGVAFDSPITKNFKQIRLSTLLDLMLEELGLIYSQKDDLIVITTPDDADATMEVRVYDCRDLLAMPTNLAGRPDDMRGMPGVSGMAPRGFPGSGEGFGPPRTDSAYPGNPGAAPPGPGAAGSPVTPPPATRRPSDRRDPFAPPAVPDGFSVPPGAAPSNVPSTVPRRPDGEVLPQLGGGGGYGGGMPGGGMPGGDMMGDMAGGQGVGRPQRPLSEQDVKAEQLMEILTTAVDPQSWSEQGGPGTIGQYNGLIVVSQSARTHTKVEKVLDMLREAASRAKSPKNPVVRY